MCCLLLFFETTAICADHNTFANGTGIKIHSWKLDDDNLACHRSTLWVAKCDVVWWGVGVCVCGCTHRYTHIYVRTRCGSRGDQSRMFTSTSSSSHSRSLPVTLTLAQRCGKSCPKIVPMFALFLTNTTRFRLRCTLTDFPPTMAQSAYPYDARICISRRTILTPMQAKQTSSLTHTRAQNSLELFHHQEIEKIFLLGTRRTKAHFSRTKTSNSSSTTP